MSLPKEIDNLLKAYFGGDTSVEVIHALEVWMRENKANPRIFAEYGLLDRLITAEQRQRDATALFSLLLDQEGSIDAIGVLNPDDSAAAMALAELAKLHEEGLDDPISLEAHRKSRDRSVDHVSRRTKVKARLIVAGGLAAVIAVSAAVALVISMLAQPTQNTTIVEEPADERIIVATLTATHDSAWDQQKPGGDHRPGALRQGTQLAVGQRLTLTQGFAEITTNDGAVALIQAPATIEMLDNDNAIRLHAGKLVGICETDSSKGFLVRTPHLDVTDLGTRFGVDASDGDGTYVHVMEGMVDVATLTAEGQTTQRQTLLAGGSARVGAETDSIETIDHDATVFADLNPKVIPLPGTGRGLAFGDTDPNWQLIAIDGVALTPPRELPVNNGGSYVRTHPNDPASSQWLAWRPPVAEQVQAECIYRIRTVVELPESIPANARIVMSYMADNELRAAYINGHRVAMPRVDITDMFTIFHNATIDRHLKPGANTIEFDLVNIRVHGGPRSGDAGFRLAWELELPAFSSGPAP